MRVLTLLSVLLAGTGSLATDYIVRNHCPTPIEWFIGETSQGTLATGDSALRTGLAPYAGYFYTNANGGDTVVDGSITAARAGFFFEPGYWFYYIVRDPNSHYFNTGISITPSNLPNNGFCNTAACLDGNCTTAYRTPPRFRGPPLPEDEPAHDPPVYQCKIPGTNFDIAFCPGGNWPQARGSQIFPNYNKKKCIDVRGNVLANGTPVQIYDCNDTNAQRFEFSYGSTQVRVKGTNFCLDAGSSPGNGIQMKIWQCYDNLPAQKWFLTQDHRIALEGTGLCLDLPNGDTTNARVLQTWTCSDYNNNQAWSLPNMVY